MDRGRPGSTVAGDTVIGPYTAVGRTARRVRGAIVWQWRCECGATHYAAPGVLRAAHARAPLVCAHGETGRPPRDLVGVRNGSLVVQEIARQERNKEYVWWCACDCGARTTVRASRLRPGGTMMCASCAADRRRTPDGYRIRDARARAGLTLEEAGRLCGVSKQRAEQWENQIRVADVDFVVTTLTEYAARREAGGSPTGDDT